MSSPHLVAYSLPKNVDDLFSDRAEVVHVGPKQTPVDLERFSLMVWGRCSCIVSKMKDEYEGSDGIHHQKVRCLVCSYQTAPT